MIAIETSVSALMRFFFFGGIMKKLLETIYRKSLKSFDFQTMEDLLYMSKEAMKTDIPLGVEYLRKLSALCEKQCQTGLSPGSR